MASSLHAFEILAAGDTTLAGHLTPELCPSLFSPQTRERIAAADLFVWNCETSGTAAAYKQNRFVFQLNPLLLPEIAFPNGVAVIANNHVFDGFAEGARQLRDELNEAGIPTVGLRDSGEDIVFQPTASLPVAVLASSPMIHEKGEFTAPPLSELISRICSIRQQSDGTIILVMVHDGIEGTPEPTKRQRYWADELSRAGADIILFAHSHRYGQIEHLPGPRNPLVVWSLGNFIFGGNWGWANRQDVRLLSITKEEQGFEGRWIIGSTQNWSYTITPCTAEE